MMKKRFIAFTLTAFMAFASATAVYAEEEAEATTAAIEINWSDYEDEVAASEDMVGDFVEFEEVAVKMFLPDFFEAEELTDADLENGFIGNFTMGDTAHIGVQFGSMDGMGLDEFAESLIEEKGVTDLNREVINGLDGISFTNPQNDAMGIIAFGTDDGRILAFNFSPINDEDFLPVWQVIVASIQAV